MYMYLECSRWASESWLRYSLMASCLWHLWLAGWDHASSHTSLEIPLVCPAHIVDNMAMNNFISHFGTHIQGWWFEISCCDLTLLWGVVKSWKPFSPTYACWIGTCPRILFLHPVATQPCVLEWLYNLFSLSSCLHENIRWTNRWLLKLTITLGDICACTPESD